jgi:hypothetical protein
MRSNGLILALWVGFVLSPQSNEAQSPIAGNWKIDPSRTSFPTAPEVFLLKKGKYQCKGCLPPFAVRAEAADHHVKGSPYFDTIRVSVLDDDIVEQIEKYHGRTVVASRIKVSTDGATALFDSEEHLSADADPLTTRLVLKRVSKVSPSVQAGSTSGCWMILGYENPTENGSVFRVAVEHDTIAMTPATDGFIKKAASFAQLGKYTFVETLTRDGKDMRMRRFMVDPVQRNQMAIIDDDMLTGITLVLHAVRQPAGGPW